MSVKTRRSSYGLTLGDEGPSWRRQAICDLDSHIITGPPGGAGGAVAIQVGRALHMCRHCPVLAPCLADARSHPNRTAGTVQGGVYWVHSSAQSGAVESRTIVADPGCGPHCARLLRQGGLK